MVGQLQTRGPLFVSPFCDSDTILKLATKGNVILIGRGAHILTRHFKGAAHARIVAPIEMRGRRAAEINACSYKQPVARFTTKIMGEPPICGPTLTRRLMIRWRMTSP